MARDLNPGLLAFRALLADLLLHSGETSRIADGIQDAMTYAAATARMDRLTRQVEAAAAELTGIDAEIVRRAGDNWRAFQARELIGPAAEGTLSANVEALLGVIERITRP